MTGCEVNVTRPLFGDPIITGICERNAEGKKNEKVEALVARVIEKMRAEGMTPTGDNIRVHEASDGTIFVYPMTPGELADARKIATTNSLTLATWLDNKGAELTSEGEIQPKLIALTPSSNATAEQTNGQQNCQCVSEDVPDLNNSTVSSTQ